MPSVPGGARSVPTDRAQRAMAAVAVSRGAAASGWSSCSRSAPQQAACGSRIASSASLTVATVPSRAIRSAASARARLTTWLRRSRNSAMSRSRATPAARSGSRRCPPSTTFTGITDGAAHGVTGAAGYEAVRLSRDVAMAGAGARVRRRRRKYVTSLRSIIEMWAANNPARRSVRICVWRSGTAQPGSPSLVQPSPSSATAYHRASAGILGPPPRSGPSGTCRIRAAGCC